MHVPDPPAPGQVIRYSYLWSTDDEKGLEEGSPRPCLILAVDQRNSPPFVIVLPISRSPVDRTSESAIALSQRCRDLLGLDAADSWLIFSEYNVFEWSSLDARPISGRHPSTCLYGIIPAEYFDRAKAEFVKRARAGHPPRRVSRTGV
jgi:hypothetical protein